MTPGEMPVSSLRRSRSAAAEASGSSGSRITVPGPFAFDASTPAEAQTKPCLRARDHERRPRAHDLRRLVQDHLHLPRVAFVACELDGPRGRLDLVQADDATLDLRHHLLRHDDDVAGLETAHACAGLRQQPTEIVPFLELGNARQSDHPHLAGAPILVLVHDG